MNHPYSEDIKAILQTKIHQLNYIFFDQSKAKLIFLKA